MEWLTIHGAEGGSHFCIFCQRSYRCVTLHEVASSQVNGGGRCCPDCRTANVKALDRLGVGRSSMFQP